MESNIKVRRVIELPNYIKHIILYARGYCYKRSDDIINDLRIIFNNTIPEFGAETENRDIDIYQKIIYIFLEISEKIKPAISESFFSCLFSKEAKLEDKEATVSMEIFIEHILYAISWVCWSDDDTDLNIGEPDYNILPRAQAGDNNLPRR